MQTQAAPPSSLKKQVKKALELWKSVPDKEYRLWIPPLTSKLNIFTLDEKANECFAKFFKLDLDPSKPLEQAITPPIGFTVRPYGSSLGTKGQTNCGDKAITDLFGGFGDSKKTKVFDKMFNMLQEMGYVPGLTYQALPYDFRLSYRNNQINEAFEKNLVRLNKLTNKKTIVMSHSLGSVNTYNQLLRLDQNKKDSLIKSWVNVAGPLLGAPKAIKTLISGDSEFLFFKMIGLHFKAAAEVCNSTLSDYELIPTDAFTLYKNKSWFKDIKKWTAYEQGEITYEEAGFSFLPKKEEKCAVRKYTGGFDTQCKFGLFDTSKETMFKIKDEEYKMNEFEKLLSKWGISDKAAALYKLTRDSNLTELRNPGVPIVSVFVSKLKTEKSYTYKDEDDEFYNPNTVTHYGDGTVPSYSPLIPALKWAKEFEKGQRNANPVKIVELCSTYNRKKDLYDHKDKSGEKSFTNNEYVGLKCQCEFDQDLKQCEHQFMNTDNGFLEMFKNLLISSEGTSDKLFSSFISTLSAPYLKQLTTECPQIVYHENQGVPDEDMFIVKEKQV